MSENVNAVQIDISPCKEEVSDKDKLAWAKAHPEVENWIRGKKDKLAPLKHFMNYCKATGFYDRPETLLDLREKKIGRDSQGIVLLERFQEEYKNEYGNTPQLHSITKWVKSFYSFYDLAIPRQRAKCQYQRVRERPKWKREDLLKFSEGQSKRFRAMISFLSSIPCRAETLSKLTWYHVREILNETISLPYVYVEPKLLKGEGYGKDIDQHGFIHGWAKKKLLEWKEEYEALTGKKILLSDAKSLLEPLWISYNEPHEKLSKNQIERDFEKRSEECGVKITTHSFRAYMRDALSCDDDDKAPFIAHKSSYSGAYTMKDRERLQEFFLEAQERLDPTHGSRLEANRKKLDKICEEYGLNIPTEARAEITRQLMMGLVSLEQQFEKMKTEFLTQFVARLTEEKAMIKRVEAQKRTEEEKRRKSEREWKEMNEWVEEKGKP